MGHDVQTIATEILPHLTVAQIQQFPFQGLHPVRRGILLGGQRALRRPGDRTTC